MRHYIIVIKGRVQGVNFRWSAKHKATSLGLVGIVRNQDDAVYIEVEGEDDALMAFIGWCRKGPIFAKVNDLQFVEGEIRGYNTFEIKHN